MREIHTGGIQSPRAYGMMSIASVEIYAAANSDEIEMDFRTSTPREASRFFTTSAGAVALRECIGWLARIIEDGGFRTALEFEEAARQVVMLEVDRLLKTVDSMEFTRAMRRRSIVEGVAERLAEEKRRMTRKRMQKQVRKAVQPALAARFGADWHENGAAIEMGRDVVPLSHFVRHPWGEFTGWDEGVGGVEADFSLRELEVLGDLRTPEEEEQYRSLLSIAGSGRPH